MQKLFTYLFSLLLLSTAFGLRAENGELALHGTGSSFAAGAYRSWATSYMQSRHISIDYQATGSGEGIRQSIAHAVDFGGSDYPLSQDELAKHNLLQFPTLVGGIVPVINLPGIKPGQLKLTGTVLAAIFAGHITVWNHREIQNINPHLDLPNLPIQRIVRADDSGTTAGFTEYLSLVDLDWNKTIGTGLHVNWPAGAETAKGNGGMAKAVLATPGSIGYVSANQVASSKLAYVLLQNRAKQFVAPTDEALLAAVKATVVRRGEPLSFINAFSPAAWPITDATYVLIERTPKNTAKASHVLRFFYWAFLRGDRMASETGYVPLPTSVQARVIGSFKDVRDANGASLNLFAND